MPDYLSPGVYIEEFESGSRPLGGASTSIAGFLGVAQRGESEGIPELVTSFADFQRKFGGYLSAKQFGEYRFLSYAVEHFFINGGGICFVMRVLPSDAKQSFNTVEVLEVKAKNAGTWGDRIKIEFMPSSKSKSIIKADLGAGKYRLKSNVGFNVGDIVVFKDAEDETVALYRKVLQSVDNTVTLDTPLEGDVVEENLLPKKLLSTCEFNVRVSYGDEVEDYEWVSLNDESSTFIENKLMKSNLIKVKMTAPFEEITHPFNFFAKDEADFAFDLKEGSDGTLENITPDCFMGVDNGPGKRTGIQAFIDNDEVSIMAIPGVTTPTVQLALVAHCENTMKRFAVLDVPRENKKVSDVMNHRNIFDSDYAAMYHPWLNVYDPLDKVNLNIPPSGSVLGIYARSDNSRGVHKAPANEIVKSAVGLDCQYNKGEQDILNPKGVNLIRYFTGQGIRVWGARTTTSNSLWKYINVRRLFIFVEESVRRGTDWVVFEPNDEKLWARVERTLDNFLTTVWRNGALAGGSTSEAFYIKVDRTTMTQDDIDNGRLICEIGIAPVKPAEFVVFRFTQKTGE